MKFWGCSVDLKWYTNYWPILNYHLFRQWQPKRILEARSPAQDCHKDCPLPEKSQHFGLPILKWIRENNGGFISVQKKAKPGKAETLFEMAEWAGRQLWCSGGYPNSKEITQKVSGFTIKLLLKSTYIKW